MDERALFRSGDRREWRKWLSENYMTAPEIWLVYSTKGSGDECIAYNDSVEEALCFGWIDSTLRRIDPDHYARRFTPRRKNSDYSRANIERLIWLDSRGLICPDVRETVADIISEPFVFPEDIIAELKKDDDVWRYYVSFSESYKRIRVSYIDSARDRPAEFRKRLDNFIKRTRENKKISGYGGIDRYYRSGAEILFHSHAQCVSGAVFDTSRNTQNTTVFFFQASRYQHFETACIASLIPRDPPPMQTFVPMVMIWEATRLTEAATAIPSPIL